MDQTKSLIILLNKEIAETMLVVNDVLGKIGAPHLLENDDFELDDMSGESWIKLNLRDRGSNSIPLSMTFTPTDVEIRIDRVAEAIEWSNKQILESRPAVMEILRNLFISHVLVEHHGRTHTRISFYGQDGMRTNCFKYYEGFGLKGKREDRLYYPIYKRKKGLNQ